MFDSPHRRFNPLSREWVMVSPHRAKRPWQGQIEKHAIDALPTYDPGCYLCPGNERAGGVFNPPFTGPFVFDNDFAALLPGEAIPEAHAHPLLIAQPESGICRVVCFSPRHDLTLPELPLPEVEAVIATWMRESADLAARPEIAYVQVFENKGAMMGCSNPHPHSQIWSQSRLPNEPAKELASQTEYYDEHHAHLLLDYLAEEEKQNVRIIAANEYFVALVPFWAIWPFEVMLVSRKPVARLQDLTTKQVSGMADAMHQITVRYDNLFETSFPYSMGFHQAPADGLSHPEWILHAHFYPPLLRSATVRKFMVGYELMAMPQRDITPETAADRLKQVSAIHYKIRK
jgi:UDPglucose--hexose-1-phosphate uridylyltransferase